MEAMCRQALKIGLPALAFTEHLDITGWAIGQEDLLNHLRPLVDANGVLTPSCSMLAATWTALSGAGGSFPNCASLLAWNWASRTSTEMAHENW